jgi:hypothetical protein
MPQAQEPVVPTPRTVSNVKKVEFYLIEYVDNDGVEKRQLTVVGDQTVLLADGRVFGISTKADPTGVGSKWLRDGVFERLGKPIPKDD